MNTYPELGARTALITGVSGAIGSAIASKFGASGARVAGTFRSNLAEAKQALEPIPEGRRALFQAALDSPAAARALWDDAQAWHPLDTLVLNAAMMAPTRIFDEDDSEWDEGWEEVFKVNVQASAALMREATKNFAERGKGTVIVISSWAAEQGSRIPEASAYAASKSALRNLAQTLARATARNGVRFYTIAPGVVDGGMGTSGLTEREIRDVAEGLVMGKHVRIDEIAELTAFLATDRCPNLTGSTIDLNGASYVR